MEVNEKLYSWYSPHIEKEFKMLTFGTSGVPMLLYATSKGSYMQNRDFGLVEAIGHWIENGMVKVYCPDSFDAESFYNYQIPPKYRLLNYLAYERLILNELMPMMWHDTGHDKCITAGCSFGGYHALNTAFKHPDKVQTMISMGGAFDIKQFIFGYFDDNCYFNNPPDYMKNLSDPWYVDHLRKMGIILGTGEKDICQAANIEMSEILDSKGIPNWLDNRPGFEHDWPWWKIQFVDYMKAIF
ncbi:MAG: esterase family protein [Fimbriimonadaceae bacterium]